MSGHKLLAMVTNTTQTRIITLVTILWFGFVFNIERLASLTSVNFGNAMYAVIAISGIILLAFPNFENMRFLHSGGVVLLGYLAATIVLGNWHHYTSQPALWLLEIAVLLVSFFLLRQLSHLLLDLETGMQLFVQQPEHSSFLSFEQGRSEVEKELQRAYRFNRCVACIYCEVYDPKDCDPRPVSLSDNIQESIQLKLKQHYEQSELGRHITTLTYKSDMVLAFRNGFLIFLPETSKEELSRFLDELTFLTETNQQLHFLIGESYFPEDGIHFDDLVGKARSNTRVFLNQDRQQNGFRGGDVYVAIEQRLAIENQSEWVNKLAYQSPSARMIYRPVKRLMDLAASLLVVPLLIPFILAIMLLIYLDDGWPVFYEQQRTGYGGRRFNMIKFRTMKVNAPPVQPNIIQTDDGQTRYVWPDKDDHDPRITRIGRFLRKTSLDEIPQIWNVLVGDMSLVGPRPTTWNVDMYTLLQTERLNVRPGITGLWQVSARETKNFDERLLWDVKYVEKMSLWLDILILWKTAAQIINRRGA
jgi:lipopolysaccharide/colanic/teichoic acid biosynthesis glycosyltransferase